MQTYTYHAISTYSGIDRDNRCNVVQGQLPCYSTKKTWDSSKAWSWKFSKNGFSTALPNVKQTHNQSICNKHVL
jgi:hypothetical protein